MSQCPTVETIQVVRMGGSYVEITGIPERCAYFVSVIEDGESLLI